MSLLTASFFKTLYPAFKDEADATIEAQILLSKNKVLEDKFGSSYEEAVLTYVAHEFEISKLIESGDEFAGREITSYSVAGQSFGFKASKDDGNDLLRSTVYGRKFLELENRSSTPSFPMSVG
jgi:hypothetical protein